MSKRFIILGKHLSFDELYEIYDMEKGISLGYTFNSEDICKRLNN
jgi:hypothetical protein